MRMIVMSNNSSIIKKVLEDKYDIPFSVDEGTRFADPWFDIKPANRNEELFEIHAELKNHIRIVLEIRPERYSAFSINDMSNADNDKKQLFTEYASQIKKKKAKLDFYINNTPHDAENYTDWPQEWRNYRCRISKSPVVFEGESFDLVETVSEWTSLATGMFLSLLNVIKIEETSSSPDLMTEGGIRRVTLDRYERNPINRELCLLANGYTCKVCGFNFEKQYGKLGENFIHVHHIIPISHTKSEYVIDPVKDLIPVCPNCHAMLHKSDPPLMPEQLKSIIEANRDKQSNTFADINQEES